MADPMQKQKSDDGSLRESDRFVLPVGETIETPIEVPLELLLEGCEELRTFWKENYFDEQAAIEDKNPERFEM